MGIGTDAAGGIQINELHAEVRKEQMAPGNGTLFSILGDAQLESRQLGMDFAA
jgi:hypothetical protein